MIHINIEARDALEIAAKKLLDACHEFWRTKSSISPSLGGAVHWVEDMDGRLVVFTRGEYAEVIKDAIRRSDGFETTRPTIRWGETTDA